MSVSISIAANTWKQVDGPGTCNNCPPNSQSPIQSTALTDCRCSESLILLPRWCCTHPGWCACRPWLHGRERWYLFCVQRWLVQDSSRWVGEPLCLNSADLAASRLTVLRCFVLQARRHVRPARRTRTACLAAPPSLSAWCASVRRDLSHPVLFGGCLPCSALRA